MVTPLPRTKRPLRCVLRTPSWAENHPPVPLRFGPESEPFAFLEGGVVKLTLGDGPEAGASLTSRSQGIALEAVVKAGDLSFLPRRALTFEGFVIPLPTTSLVYRGRTATGKPLVQHVLVVNEQETRGLTRAVECDDLSLDVQSFDAEYKLGIAHGVGAEAVIVARRLPLSATAGGAPTVTFSLRSGRTAKILDRVPGWARIRWYRREELVFGWVPSDALKPLSLGNMWDESVGRVRDPDRRDLSLSGAAELPPQRLACAAPIELLGELGGIRQPVGEIAPGTVFEVYQRHAPLTQVYLQTSDVRRAGGARWLVAAAEIDRCQRQ